MTVAVRPLAPADAAACDAIIRGHPELLGHPSGLSGGDDFCPCSRVRPARDHVSRR